MMYMHNITVQYDFISSSPCSYFQLNFIYLPPSPSVIHSSHIATCHFLSYTQDVIIILDVHDHHQLIGSTPIMQAWQDSVGENFLQL